MDCEVNTGSDSAATGPEGEKTMNDELRKEIEQLRRHKTLALKSRYLELFGEESRSSNHAHLFRRIAWRLQALSEGDLSERARERAATLAVDVDLRLRAPRKFWGELAAPSPGPNRDPRLPAAGTLLERQYRGITVSVKILADGFEHNGKICESLSSIASSVTGTRWNGFSFFGLNKQGQHD
jgi:Protein of unknown function (DUF2924)